MVTAIETNDSYFQKDVLESPIPVLVDFWAEWCGPCRMISPVVEALASEYAGRIRVVKLNADENSATANKFGVSALPTMLLFKNGEVVDAIVGAVGRKPLVSRIEAVL